MLKVSDNRRFLVHDDGTPFFFLGDTAWALFQRLNREESDRYLEDRATKGFTVIQAVALSEFDGLRVPNQYGDLPLEDGNPLRPNEAYFRHVDYVVDKAAALGLWIGLLPTWGDKVGPKKWGIGPEVFTPENAEQYGAFLGSRYRDKNVIWILGGDRNPDNEGRKAIWRSMAAGVKQGDGGRHLMTYHPLGVTSTSVFFPDEEWIDFNMMQSCHLVWDRDNYNYIVQDYELVDPKPCMDSEPNYEDMPVAMRLGNGYFGAYDARKAAYWALFAGAHGHTYGANGIFQFWNGVDRDFFNPLRPWHEALALPGASQMQYARHLLESRPFLDRIPDQRLITSNANTGTNHIRATRANDGSYAFIYSAGGLPFTLDLSKLSGQTLVAHWYDPRTGTASVADSVTGGTTCEFTPPSSGPDNDWILVLDDAAYGFPTPGTRLS